MDMLPPVPVPVASALRLPVTATDDPESVRLPPLPEKSVIAASPAGSVSSPPTFSTMF